MNQFSSLGVGARTLAALDRAGISSPLPVQEQAVPPLRSGSDVVIQAPTGSGKSLAFLLPLAGLAGLAAPQRATRGPRAMVVCPTRELALQIAAVFDTLDLGLRQLLVFGGVGYGAQLGGLRRGTDLLIGTPGRIVDLVERRVLDLSGVRYMVLDEADEMFDSGFAPIIERIIALTRQPQMVLASATMPEWVESMIVRHLRQPVRVCVEDDEESRLEHGLMRVDAHGGKLKVLDRLLSARAGSTIAFGRTKHGVARVCRDIERLGHRPQQLRGDMSQGQRQRALQAFRDDPDGVLVATNVAARGLDISHVGLVINYDLPDTPQWLTHRVGRTARNGASGRALTLLTSQDEPAWTKLRRQGAEDLPEVDSEHLLATGEWRLRPAPRPLAPIPTSSRGPRPFQHRRRS